MTNPVPTEPITEPATPTTPSNQAAPHLSPGVIHDSSSGSFSTFSGPPAEVFAQPTVAHAVAPEVPARPPNPMALETSAIPAYQGPDLQLKVLIEDLLSEPTMFKAKARDQMKEALVSPQVVIEWNSVAHNPLLDITASSHDNRRIHH